MGIKAAGVALGMLGLAAAGQASAGCGGFDKAGANFKPSVFRPGMDGFGFQSTGFSDYFPASIIGVWKIEFLAKGNTNGIPDGTLIDFGTATWYGDGTETMISGGRAPSTGDVCMGVWEQVGRFSYKLNHLAMAWMGGAYAGPTKIEETINLDPSGRTFKGHFTITAYAASATAGQEFDESTVVAPTPIKGQITGVRLTVD
jgi:hypothetical protein